MNKSFQPYKRLVTKHEYARLKCSQVLWGWMGVCLLFLAAISGIILLCFVAGVALSITFLLTKNVFGLIVLPCVLIGVALCGGAINLLYKKALFFIQKADTIGDVAMVKRSNTVYLLAEVSLVRASEEPAQEQQTILLRAATRDTGTPAIQLLRSVEDRE